jgi:hypothetical protein
MSQRKQLNEQWSQFQTLHSSTVGSVPPTWQLNNLESRQPIHLSLLLSITIQVNPTQIVIKFKTNVKHFVLQMDPTGLLSTS